MLQYFIVIKFKAVAMLQALTEYHLFVPDDEDIFSDSDLKQNKLSPLEIRELLRRRFKTFWESGLLRIGEASDEHEGYGSEYARGWKNYSRREQQEDANKYKRREKTLLEQERVKNAEKECEDKKKYMLEGYTKTDIYRYIEMNRARLYWKPVILNTAKNV